MPVSLRCSELQPGMKLFDALMLRGRVLLHAGRELSQEDVDLLRAKYARLSVRVGEPILDDVIEFEDDSHDREVANHATGTIVRAMTHVRERFAARASLRELNVGALHASVGQVVEYIKSNRPTAALLNSCLDTESYLAEHPGNVFYLSMLLGSAVREYVATERDRQTIAKALRPDFAISLTPLGLGAMFLDVGMRPLETLYHADRPLTGAEWRAIFDHPNAGADMLPDEFSPLGKMIVKTHHENFDGTGYPDGLPGNKLHIFTRIVRIADAYDAAPARHVYSNAKSPAQVLWEMTVGPYRQYYDPVLMKVLARLIQPFPIGAKLTLTDGRQAVVVRYNRQNPFLPIVVIAFDRDGKRLPNDKLQGPYSLEQRRDLRARFFGDEDVSFIYRNTLVDAPPPRPAIMTTLFEAAFP